jgi:hypothetical protein
MRFPTIEASLFESKIYYSDNDPGGTCSQAPHKSTLLHEENVRHLYDSGSGERI